MHNGILFYSIFPSFRQNTWLLWIVMQIVSFVLHIIKKHVGQQRSDVLKHLQIDLPHVVLIVPLRELTAE